MRHYLRRIPKTASAAVLFSLALATAGAWWLTAPPAAPPPVPRPRRAETPEGPRQLAQGGKLTVWWDLLPPALAARTLPAGQTSNVAPADYAGPESCKECHRRNYEAWSEHPHRWMNAPAGTSTIKGDFTGASIRYRGGTATFARDDRGCEMRLERGGVRRVYRVTQTIGSRFFQYYVGKQTHGPEPAGHRFYAEEHVLPFGYWLAEKEWVPVVHIGPEVADADRPDPFAPPVQGMYYAEYATSCNSCHTTFPLGDLFGRQPHQVGAHAPATLHWSTRPYLAAAHPELVDRAAELLAKGPAENPMRAWGAAKYAVTFGISCEACHLGAKAHVASRGEVPPAFFPTSPFLHLEGPGAPPAPGRTQANVNWACGRCHTGTRPRFAAGMSTWNSVEYDDAMLGGCYSKLRCTDCHEPHRATGPTWTAPPERDDASCLACHTKYEPAEQRTRHTHHPAGSEGSRCMSCHMPRINEGLQDLVRTHMIYSPTRPDMIEANHPNACNLCHTDRPIDWTARHLKDWYGAKLDEAKLAANYPDRSAGVAHGWLKSDNPAVRLVGADAIARAKDRKAVPLLLKALDDSHLVNRQFAGRSLQTVLGIRLADFGYRFYLPAEERRAALNSLQAELAKLPAR